MKLTEYIPPRAQQREIEVTIPAPDEALAAQLSEAGFRFTIEHLRLADLYSLTCGNHTGDMQIETFPTGVPRPLMALWLVRYAHKHWVKIGMPEAAGYNAEEDSYDDEEGA